MRNRELLINPTLTCENFLSYQEDLDILEKVGSTILHLDVMDSHYVPGLCFTPDQIRLINRNYPFLPDVRLMVTNPEDYIGPLRQAGVAYLNFHLDAISFAIRLINQVRLTGMKAGVMSNPSQPVPLLKETFPFADYTPLMDVEPGFSGRSFIPDTIGKDSELSRIREEEGHHFLIEVDGGIDDDDNIICIRHGANILVSGAFDVFRNRGGLEQDYLAFRQHIMAALEDRTP